MLLVILGHQKVSLKKVELRPLFYIPLFWVLKPLRNSTYNRDANFWRSEIWRLYLFHYFPSPSNVNKTPHPTPQINPASPKIVTVMGMVRTLYEVLHEVHTINVCIHHYKITKIVRALWLAERSVCIRVCKHGCDVRCFAFRSLITSDQNSTSLLYLLIPSSAETRKIFSNKLCQLFFA